MKTQLSLFCSLPLIGALFCGAPLCPAQSQKSDREWFGLRGSVKTCVTEIKYPARPLGATGIERTYTQIREFDADGHLMAMKWRDSGGSETSMRYIRDATGRLLETVSGKTGEEMTHVIYGYDDQGRIAKIISSRTTDSPVKIVFDDQGRRSMVQTSRREDYKEGWGSVEDSPFSAASRPPNLPGGGTSTILYDELDRPAEAQVRDNKGQLIQRAIRSYDAQGNIIEDKDVMGHRVLPNTPAHHEAHLNWGDEEDAPVISTKNTYDSQGRLLQTRKRAWNEEMVTESAYNEQGDIVTRIMRIIKIGSNNTGEQNESINYNEAHFDYEYDSKGNWIVSTQSVRSRPSDALEETSSSHRTLTYY